MKILAPALAVFALVHVASAGIVLVEEMEQTGGPMPGKMQMTITSSGDNARVDIGKDISSIVNSKTGTVTSLMHSQKMAMQLPEGTFDAIKKNAASAAQKPELKATGKKQTINGFDCEEYTAKISGFDVTFWLTKAIANQNEILDQLGKISGGSDPVLSALSSGGEFPGFPIRTIMKTPQMGTMTMTVSSLKNEDVPESVFEIPSGYKKMSMPKMQQPGGGAPAVPAAPDAQ